MNMRKEVCELANEIAKQRGGQPHQYMGEAWERVRQKQGLSTKRVPIKINRDKQPSQEEDEDEEVEVYRPSRTRAHSFGFKNKMKETTKKSIRTTAESCNFMKAPKDSPREVFGDIGLKRTDPIPKIPDSIKNMIKFW